MSRDDAEPRAEFVDDRTGVSVSLSGDGTSLEVVDPIERHRFALSTSDEVALRPADEDQFRLPVDLAVSVATRKISLPTVVLAYVRDETGTTVAEAEHFAYQELPAGVYSIELCAPVKLYLRLEGAVTVAADAERTYIEFDGETDVSIGARTHHDHPAETITTTEDPVDVMAAVSTFGSALKTTSCERSYPTLRGHPPTIELGDELDVPEQLRAPDTGVRIEVPADLGAVFVVAPLAYYLGATVVPGPVPRIVTDHGFEHVLDTPVGFEREVERVLKQVFFLDCITRTEGYYQVDLDEREAIEPLVDLDFAELYDRPLAKQLAAYLSVPYAVVEDHVPKWKLTTHVAPTPEYVETIPFVVDDLAVIRTPRRTPVVETGAQTVIDEFLRDEFTRSGAESSPGPQLVRPAATDSLEQAWIGDHAPLQASKGTAAAYRNRLEREAIDGDIDITVICNDAAMDEERDVVDEVYGSREELPFDVRVHRDLTVAELRTVLARETDFLHYIGHIDGAGFQCADGKLDVATLEEVGVDVFLLNACQSYEQGMALIERGAIGGIVTLSDVINSGAVTMGGNIARLVNRGFPLRSALDVARDESIVGSQYIVVGDGNVDVAQADNGTPLVGEIERSGDAFELTLHAYPTSHCGMGTINCPTFLGEPRNYLGSGALDTFSMAEEELSSTLSMESIPLNVAGRLVWSEDFDVAAL